MPTTTITRMVQGCTTYSARHQCMISRDRHGSAKTRYAWRWMHLRGSRGAQHSLRNSQKANKPIPTPAAAAPTGKDVDELVSPPMGGAMVAKLPVEARPTTSSLSKAL
eukprot:scaffold170273_cov37-Tisochrysis_lutea.AAC.1